MFAVLGEARSDAETLKVLIRRLAHDERLPVKTKGYQGGGELKRKGAKQLALYADLYHCTKFVVCYDADGPDPTHRRREIEDTVTKPSRLHPSCCIVIPVQELEAWILADIEAVTRIFTGWRPEPIRNPESIQSPKEHLERLSREGASTPRYSHAVHNEKVAKYLNLARVKCACPSFRPLADFVAGPPSP